MLATVVTTALVFVSAPDGDTMVVRDGTVKTGRAVRSKTRIGLTNTSSRVQQAWQSS